MRAETCNALCMRFMIATKFSGGNDPPGQIDKRTYQQELAQQMAEQRMRKEQEKHSDGRDWWEKREEPRQVQEYAPPKKEYKQVRSPPILRRIMAQEILVLSAWWEEL